MFRQFVVCPLEAAIAYLLVAFFRVLPPDLASAIGGKVCRAIGPLLSLSRRAHRNLQIAFPEMGEAERNTVLAGMWENLGRLTAELPHLRALRDHGYIEVVGGDHLERSGRPLIVCTAHVGNWEIAPPATTLFGIQVDTVYRAPNNPLVDGLLRKLRRDGGGGNSIPKGGSGARAIVKALAKGGAILMVIDQKMNDGIPVPFFGRDAMTAPALASLALRYGCSVVPLQVERLAGTRFRVTVHPPMEIVSTGDRRADSLAVMTRVNALVEGWIRQRPEQWLWLHNRWPT